MNSKIKKKWVAALRSGKYKQGTRSLYNKKTNKFCCLGVLTDLYRKVKKKSLARTINQGDNLFLPNAVCEWADLDDSDPILGMKASKTAKKLVRGMDACVKLEGKYYKTKASDWNDEGVSFKKIASMIEKTL